jgi:hypothetical protein
MENPLAPRDRGRHGVAVEEIDPEKAEALGIGGARQPLQVRRLVVT